MQNVRFYEFLPGSELKCYVDASWGLVALHIIQKTPSAPFFIYATFEQADNLLTQTGKYVEDVDGRVNSPQPVTSTTPQVCLVDPKPNAGMAAGAPETSSGGSVIITDDPTTCSPTRTASYCNVPGARLYYQNTMVVTGNTANSAPSGGLICVNKRDNEIPDYVIQANAQAHAAISAYVSQNTPNSTPWSYYKLINVQYLPYDKIPDPNATNGSVYSSKPPFSATNPAASSYYQANIVVETNRSLQLFSGGLSPNISSDWNSDGSPHKNTFYAGHFYNTGGCMGCHGSQGQNPVPPHYGAGDFSVILARGSVTQPEAPSVATMMNEMTTVNCNRSLSK